MEQKGILGDVIEKNPFLNYRSLPVTDINICAENTYQEIIWFFSFELKDFAFSKNIGVKKGKIISRLTKFNEISDKYFLPSWGKGDLVEIIETIKQKSKTCT